MRLSDGGEPALMSEATATLRINVIRNKHAPVFNATSYSASIAESLGSGNGVIRIFATDADEEVGGCLM